MSLGIFMSKNLSIERESEQFSFICALTLYRPHNSDRPRNFPKNSQTTKAKNIRQDSLPELDPARSHTDSNSQNQQTSALAKASTSKTNIFASIGYLVFVAWWLFTYTTGQNILPSFASNQDTIPKADVEFIDYIQRSLDTIDRQVVATAKATPTEEENPTVVYVPIYTQAATNPTPRYAPPPVPTPIPLPPPPSQFTAIKPQKITLPPPPKPSAKLEIVEIPKPEEKKVATAISKPKINSTLVGLIELGEASAALFKIDGITQRIWLGETIQNTDWILKSVTQEKATITKQGKSRSLSIGESF